MSWLLPSLAFWARCTDSISSCQTWCWLSEPAPSVLSLFQFQRPPGDSVVLGHVRECLFPFGDILHDKVRKLSIYRVLVSCLTKNNRFYRRGELARCLAVFYAAQSIASAFSGLLASWRYLFLIEGVGTVVFGLFALWYLLHSAAEASFLLEDEKALAFTRMQLDSSAVVNEKLNIRDSFKILNMAPVGQY